MHLKHLLPFVALTALFTAGACTNEPVKVTPKQVLAAPPVYNYPIDNPYAATVIGVPPEMKVDYSALPIPADRSVTLYKHRPIPEGFWYSHGLQYSELLQSKPSPLVYIIGGTGADRHSSTTTTLADILYSAGFSVVLLPSPTNANFIINASANFVPGRPTQDAQDLYAAMSAIDPLVAKETKITNRFLIGYSLGALDALYTAKLDEEKKSLGFSKTLLINPPLSLYSSMKTIDDLLYRSLPHGINDADHFIKTTVQRLSNVNQTSDALDFSNERLLIEAYSQYKLSDSRLATTIGLSFRLSAANMILTADIMGHDGYIYPKNIPFTTGTPLNDYVGVALRTSFRDYFDQLYTQKYLSPGFTAQDLINEGDMQTLGGFISQHPNIGLMTNSDDVILAPGEFKALTGLFPGRAITFPTGGHLGNLAHPAVAYRVVQYMKQ